MREEQLALVKATAQMCTLSYYYTKWHTRDLTTEKTIEQITIPAEYSPPPGWQTHSLTHSDNGFYAVIFKQDNALHYAITIRGTKPVSFDWASNALLYLDQSITHVEEGISFIKEFITNKTQENLNTQFTITGHSLGATVAECALIAMFKENNNVNMTAVTFDSPGIPANYDNLTEAERVNVALRITTILSAPDLVNTVKSHSHSKVYYLRHYPELNGSFHTWSCIAGTAARALLYIGGGVLAYQFLKQPPSIPNTGSDSQGAALAFTVSAGLMAAVSKGLVKFGINAYTTGLTSLAVGLLTHLSISFPDYYHNQTWLLGQHSISNMNKALQAITDVNIQENATAVDNQNDKQLIHMQSWPSRRQHEFNRIAGWCFGLLPFFARNRGLRLNGAITDEKKVIDAEINSMHGFTPQQ